MAIDKRILNLSYSSLLTLHSCPRKFQLYRLNAKAAQEDDSSTLTFAYGHTVGSGIQYLLEGQSLPQVLWRSFLEWECDLLLENPKQQKSFWGAIHALRQFDSILASGYLKDYEIVQYQGKPACELSFSITTPDGFVFRGFVDAVLRNIHTGKIVVLECKTSSDYAVNPSKFKNSAQAIGYSIVLDVIFPELSAYEVLYLIYQTKSSGYTQLPFEKSFYQRALWIREFMLDIEMIKLYEEAQIYPMHGESCFGFGRDCEYLQVCTLSTGLLTEPLSAELSEKLDRELEKFQIKLTLNDLIQAQLDKPGVYQQLAAPQMETITDNVDELL